jgi:hypothetical protein
LTRDLPSNISAVFVRGSEVNSDQHARLDHLVDDVAGFAIRPIGVRFDAVGWNRHIVLERPASDRANATSDELTFDVAVRSDKVVVEGAPAPVPAFPKGLSWTPMARFVHLQRAQTG